MQETPGPKSLPDDDAIAGADAATTRFRLTRYFSATALFAFLVVALALYWLERRESIFFREVQQAQQEFVGQLQEEFARQQEMIARHELLAVHEAAHVNLTRLTANALWTSHIAPFLSKAERVPIDLCRALAGDPSAAPDKAANACYVAVRDRIMALPEFSPLDSRVKQVMRNSTVFKVKVFDLRGLTIYSSEHAQVAEDKSDNQGWRTASRGQAASELTHRDRFSAFEGVVENRDLISSYVPVFAPGSDEVRGVFEIYSDVTPFLERINVASAGTAALATENRARLARAAAENQRKVDQGSGLLLAIVGVLLLLLYGALLLLVQRAQRIIDAHSKAQIQAIRREAQWHREKMAALAAMSASMSHEIGNPLATIMAVADDIADRQRRGDPIDDAADRILEQTHRIAAKTRQMADFAAARSEAREPVDTNQMVKAVCDFLGFDRRFRSTSIEFAPASNLPALVIVPDHLTEALMRLLEACAPNNEESQAGPNRILIETLSRGANVVIRIGHDGWEVGQSAIDPRIDSARRRVAGMGGRIVTGEGIIEVELAASAQQSPAG